MDNNFNFEEYFNGMFGNNTNISNKICPICSKRKQKIKNIKAQMKRNVEFARKTSSNEHEYLVKIKDYYVKLFKEIGELQ